MKIGLGLASTVLGTIGLLLFFLPILGIPISGAGLVLGFLSFLGSRFKGSAVGIAVCTLALAINLAIAYSPAGSMNRSMNNRSAMEAWPTKPYQPYVPPPASTIR